jgi:hypothetical protein
VGGDGYGCRDTRAIPVTPVLEEAAVDLSPALPEGDVIARDFVIVPIEGKNTNVRLDWGVCALTFVTNGSAARAASTSSNAKIAGRTVREKIVVDERFPNDALMFSSPIEERGDLFGFGIRTAEEIFPVCMSFF